MNSNNELIITRTFHAPPERVWKIWTEPSHIKQWWGPTGFTCPVAKVDLRAGGKYLYCMRGTFGPFEGKDFWSGGEFKVVEPHRRLVVTDHFADDKGNKVDPSTFGMPADMPKEMHLSILFEPHGDKTKLSLVYTLPSSAAQRDAMMKSGLEQGWSTSLDKFQAVVEQ